MAKSQLQTRVLPPGPFWNRNDVRGCLARRDAGALLGLVRLHTGASQQTIGSAIDMAQPHVSAIMCGRRSVTALDTWLRVADGLSMPSQARRVLGLAASDSENEMETSWTESSLRVSDSSPAADMAREMAEQTLRDLMKRREAFAIGGTILVGAALTELLERWTAPGTPGTRRGGSTIGVMELERIEAATVCLRHWDERWRMGTRRKAVIGQLSEVSELVEHRQRPDVQQRLFAVMAELARVVGSMSFDSGDHGTAQRYYSLSLRAVRYAGPEHSSFGVRVLADMARQMLDLHHPEDALDITRLALDQAASLGAPPSVRALLRTREGWSYARMGRVASFERTVGQAQDLLAREEGPAPEWSQGFDEAELAGVVGARYRDLGRSLERPESERFALKSVEYISSALERRGAGRGRTLDLIGLGRTYAALGEGTESARSVRAALGSGPGLASGRVRRRLHDWYVESSALHKNPDTAAIRDELPLTLLATP